MRTSITHLSDLLDAKAVEVLFQGHAKLVDDYLEFKDCMADFVTHRLELMNTRIRLIEVESGLEARISIPAYDLYLEVYIPYVMDEEHAIHEAIHQLRFSGRHREAEMLDAALPDILWYLDVKQYLDARRRLRNIEEIVESLERKLHPAVHA